MNQPCINCGSQEVETTEGSREISTGGEIFYVQRVCESCGFSLRVRWGNVPDMWESSGLERHTTYVFVHDPYMGRRIGIVPYGVLLVGDEQEIGPSE